MNKEQIVQDNILVVYTDDADMIEDVYHNILKSVRPVRHLWDMRNRKLTVLLPDNTQECYSYVKYFPNGVESICGAEFVYVRYLTGKYSSEFINLAQSRCRGGSWMVDKI